MKVFVVITKITYIEDSSDTKDEVKVFRKLKDAQAYLVRTDGVDDQYMYDSKIHQTELL